MLSWCVATGQQHHTASLAAPVNNWYFRFHYLWGWNLLSLAKSMLKLASVFLLFNKSNDQNTVYVFKVLWHKMIRTTSAFPQYLIWWFCGDLASVFFFFFRQQWKCRIASPYLSTSHLLSCCSWCNTSCPCMCVCVHIFSTSGRDVHVNKDQLSGLVYIWSTSHSHSTCMYIPRPHLFVY